MHIEIITPDKKIFEGEASAATFPGVEGSFQILNDHTPLVSTLAKGPLVIDTADGRTTYLVDGGLVEVRKNKVLVLAESIA